MSFQYETSLLVFTTVFCPLIFALWINRAMKVTMIPTNTSPDTDEAEIPKDVTPLLSHVPRQSSSPSQNALHPVEQRSTIRNPSSHIVLYFMAIHFLLSFTEIILVAPLIRLFENSLCVSYQGFPEGGVDESLCKLPDIQRPLATIRGWKSMSDTIPVLLVAVPFGKLGDRYGRKRIMVVALVGVAASLSEIFVVCAFPKVFSLRLVWASSALLLCGGGLNSASAYMWAMASETIPSERRSHAFYYIFSAFYVAEMIASFVASITIDISPWIPCSLAVASVFLCLFLLTISPSPGGIRNDQYSVSQSDDPATPPFSNSQLPQTDSTPAKSISALISSKNIIFTIPVFLVGIFRYTTLNVLIQYASFRFGVKISTSATFYTETAIINIFLFLFLVPQSTSFVRERFSIRPQIIDLFLVRTSVSLMCLGALCIGLAQTKTFLPIGVAIFASGFGSRVSALSLISYWTPDSSKASIYASIVVLESLGHAFGDPSMLQIFAASLRFSPFWQALPFFVAAGLYAVAVLTSSFIRLEKSEEVVDSRELIRGEG